MHNDDSGVFDDSDFPTLRAGLPQDLPTIQFNRTIITVIIILTRMRTSDIMDVVMIIRLLQSTDIPLLGF